MWSNISRIRIWNRIEKSSQSRIRMHLYDIHIKIEYEYRYLYLHFKQKQIWIIQMFSHPNHPQPPVRAGRSAQWISVRIPRWSPRDQDSQTCRSRGAGRCPLLLPGSLTPARPASRRQRPGQSITGPDPEAAPENPCVRALFG